MKIIRYQDSKGAVRYAARQPNGTALAITGDIFSAFEVTKEPAEVEKLLAPVAPAARRVASASRSGGQVGS